MMYKFISYIVLILSFSYNSFAGYKGIFKIGQPYEIDGQWFYPEVNNNYDETGVASWYGDKFHKKKTANGEIFYKSDISAAHTTLPLPCMVKVVNLENNKSIIVKVNDRGPFVKNRIIDLSEKAAERLGFLQQGTATVRVTFLAKETSKLHKKLFGEPML